jgi:hypothetical protein
MELVAAAGEEGSHERWMLTAIARLRCTGGTVWISTVYDVLRAGSTPWVHQLYRLGGGGVSQ